MSQRRSRIAVGLITLIALVLAGCGSTSSAATPRSFYGMVPETTLTQNDFDKMKEAGVGSLRFLIFWPSVKPGLLSAYDWDHTDAIVLGAAERGIKLLPYLDGTPTWASGRTGPYATRYDPLDTVSGNLGWNLFVQAAVDRYKPGGTFWQENPDVKPDPIHTWMVWNEQNSSNSFRPSASPGRYERLLETTSNAIRTADPSSKVVLGGMFGTPGGGGAKAHTAWGFLQQLYDRGAKPYFDGVALHPYSPDLSGIRYQIKKIRHTMAANGDSHLPLYLTELGWGSNHKHLRGLNLVKTPQQQAQLLTQSYRMLAANRERWKIGGVYWFSWRDPPSNAASPCRFCRSSGLLTKNGQPKPSYSAYVNAAH